MPGNAKQYMFADQSEQWQPGALWEGQDPVAEVMADAGMAPSGQPLQQGATQGFAPQQGMPTGGTPPFNPAAPAPGGMPTGAAPAPNGQPGGMDAAFNSPWASMAGAAMQNLAGTAANPRAGNSVNPIQAYQEAVNKRAVLAQRDAEIAMREKTDARAAEKWEREKESIDSQETNAYAQFPKEYQTYKLSGSDLPFSDWLTSYKSAVTTSAMPADLQINAELTRLREAGDEEGYNQLMNVRRNNEGVKIGDATLKKNHFTGAYDAVDENGNTTSYRDVNEYVTGMEANRKGKLKGAELLAAQNNDFQVASGQPYDVLQQTLADSNALMADLKSGQYQGTGPIEGRVRNFLGDPETAKLKAKATMQALRNLQITNLAPVTEQEIAMIESMYAGLGSDPEQNIAILEEANHMLEAKLGQLDKMGQYYVDNDNSIEGYGTQRWTKTDPSAVDDEDPEIP